MRPYRWTVLAFVTAFVTACGPTAGSSAPPPATSAPAVTTAPAAPAASPAAAPSPSPVAAERVDGVVQSVSGSQVTLAGGRGFTLPSTARVQRSTLISGSDLKQGDYVAITAKRQPDNTLLASIVNVFPPSLGQVAPGQRPLPEGNLMTNATIDQVSGNTFTVTFPGGGARVQLAPDAKVTRSLDASPSDLTPGVSITAQVVDGAARFVTINPPTSAQPAASPSPGY